MIRLFECFLLDIWQGNQCCFRCKLICQTKCTLRFTSEITVTCEGGGQFCSACGLTNLTSFASSVMNKKATGSWAEDHKPVSMKFGMWHADQEFEATLNYIRKLYHRNPRMGDQVCRVVCSAQKPLILSTDKYKKANKNLSVY